jgi:hypothetical protein
VPLPFLHFFSLAFRHLKKLFNDWRAPGPGVLMRGQIRTRYERYTLYAPSLR